MILVCHRCAKHREQTVARQGQQRPRIPLHLGPGQGMQRLQQAVQRLKRRRSRLGCHLGHTTAQDGDQLLLTGL
jgi:hypothetical protein